MNSSLIRTLCGIAAAALLFAGLAFALDKQRDYEQALAEHDEFRRLTFSKRQASETADQALVLVNQALGVLASLEPAPREWTIYPLVVKGEMDAAQTSHLLRLLGKTDDWSFLRTRTLTLRSACGVEPCAAFFIDLQADVYAPVRTDS